MSKNETKNTLIPYVVEQTNNGERSYDIFSRMLNDRIIFLTGEVRSDMASVICAQLHFLNSQDKTKPISIYIDSPGGSCSAGLSIIGTMNFIEAPVYTIVTGLAASMGAAILSAGEKRFALPDAEIMVHQASSGAEGNVQDMVVSLEQTKAVNDRLAKIISKNCGLSEAEYLKLTNRDYWMFPEQAINFGKYGIIDEIIQAKAIKREPKKVDKKKRK